MTKEEALAQYLNCKEEDIYVNEDYDVYTYVPKDSVSELDEQSYRVFTIKEAVEYAKETIKTDYDMEGIDSFDNYTKDWILENAVDYSEVDEHYIEDILIPSVEDLDTDDLLDAAIYTYSILDYDEVYEEDENDITQVKEDLDLDYVRKQVLNAAKEELDDKITVKNNEEYKEYVLDYIFYNPEVVDIDSVAEELVGREGVDHFLGDEIDLDDSPYYAYRINN